MKRRAHAPAPGTPVSRERAEPPPDPGPAATARRGREAAPRVALLIETSNRYARDLLHGVHDWMTRHERWAVRITEHSRLAGLPGWVGGWTGDGIIARVDCPATARALRETGLPIVDVSAERARSEFPRITIDNAAVARLAAEHLVRCGFRNFGFLGDRRFVWSDERGEAFARALAALGLPCAVFGTGRGSDGPPVDGAAIDEWLQALPKPTGILACYDGRALDLLESCQRLGFRVPADVGVIGVDDDEVLCALPSPPLTSVLPNARLAGYRAADLLARAMRGEPVAPETEYIAPLRVVERHSTDMLAVDEPRIAAALRYIKGHACEGINVADVLRAVPMSRTYFDQRFKRLVGHSPHEEIVRRKLERARELLVDTDRPMPEIAEATGFESANYLCTVFRQTFGLSLNEFRRSHRAGRRSE